MGDFQNKWGLVPRNCRRQIAQYCYRGMSPGQMDVAVPFDFPNFSLLLTYLLTYLKVINPHNSGIAAPIATKLHVLNASPLGSKLVQFGRNRRISNTTSGPVGQSST